MKRLIKSILIFSIVFTFIELVVLVVGSLPFLMLMILTGRSFLYAWLMTSTIVALLITIFTFLSHDNPYEQQAIHKSVDEWDKGDLLNPNAR